MRSIKNKMAEELLEMEARGATLEDILTKVAGKRTKETYGGGDPEASMLPSGQVVGLIDGLKSVKGVIDDTISQAKSLLERLNSMAT